MLRYVAGGASDEEEAQLETHIVECVACRERVQALRCACEDINSLWDSWTAAEHGRAHRQLRLTEVLTTLAESDPSLAPCARRWLEQLGSVSGLSLGVLVDMERKIALSRGGSPPSSYQVEQCGAKSGAAAKTDLTQRQDLLRQLDELLARELPDMAPEVCRMVARIDAGSSQRAAAEIHREGGGVLRVMADRQSRRLSVRYRPLESEPHPALVVILPSAGAAGPLVTLFGPLTEAGHLEAEFELIPSGPFWIEVGPFLPEQEG